MPQELTIDTWVAGDQTALCDLAAELGTDNQTADAADAIAPYRAMDYGSHLTTIAEIALTSQPLIREFERVLALHDLEGDVAIADQVGTISTLDATIAISTKGVADD